MWTKCFRIYCSYFDYVSIHPILFYEFLYFYCISYDDETCNMIVSNISFFFLNCEFCSSMVDSAFNQVHGISHASSLTILFLLFRPRLVFNVFMFHHTRLEAQWIIFCNFKHLQPDTTTKPTCATMSFLYSEEIDPYNIVSALSFPHHLPGQLQQIQHTNCSLPSIYDPNYLFS